MYGQHPDLLLRERSPWLRDGRGSKALRVTSSLAGSLSLGLASPGI